MTILWIIGAYLASIPLSWFMFWLGGFIYTWQTECLIEDKRLWFYKGTTLGDLNTRITANNWHDYYLATKLIPGINLMYSGSILASSFVCIPFLMFICVFIIYTTRLISYLNEHVVIPSYWWIVDGYKKNIRNRFRKLSSGISKIRIA